jgi:hypothetical protein
MENNKNINWGWILKAVFGIFGFWNFGFLFLGFLMWHFGIFNVFHGGCLQICIFDDCRPADVGKIKNSKK